MKDLIQIVKPIDSFTLTCNKCGLEKLVTENNLGKILLAWGDGGLANVADIKDEMLISTIEYREDSIICNCGNRIRPIEQEEEDEEED